MNKDNVRKSWWLDEVPKRKVINWGKRRRRAQIQSEWNVPGYVRLHRRWLTSREFKTGPRARAEVAKRTALCCYSGVRSLSNKPHGALLLHSLSPRFTNTHDEFLVVSLLLKTEKQTVYVKKAETTILRTTSSDGRTLTAAWKQGQPVIVLR